MHPRKWRVEEKEPSFLNIIKQGASWMEKEPTPAFLSQNYQCTRCIKDGGKRNSEEGNGERKDGRKEGCKSSWWGFWLYRLKGMRCKKRVVGPAAKVSSRGQGGGTVFSWPPGIKERRSTGASTNYYCTLPPGRRQGRPL